jgi:hypothetical protein
MKAPPNGSRKQKRSPEGRGGGRERERQKQLKRDVEHCDVTYARSGKNETTTGKKKIII